MIRKIDGMIQKIKSWFYGVDARRKARKIIAKLQLEEGELRRKANPRCPKCYGRGQRGLWVSTATWKACICTTNTRWRKR